MNILDTCINRKKVRKMNIFKQAEEIDADYMDYQTGIVYHIQEYNRCKRMGIPTPGIRASLHGEFIGVIREPEK